MAMFVWNIQNCNKSIVNSVSFIHVIFLVFGLFNLSLCLYEDQIGKFDWRQTYVGKVKFAEFDTVSLVKKIFVATEDNVIAALNLKSGHILWRQVLEKEEHGLIWFMSADAESTITVSGSGPVVVRGWDLNGGFLLWEWPIPQQALADKLSDVKWFLSEGRLFIVSVNVARHVEVTSYNVSSGSKVSMDKIPTPWNTQESRCVLVAPYLACLDSAAEGITLHSVLLSVAGGIAQSKSLTALAGVKQASLEPIVGQKPAVAVVAAGASLKHLLMLTDAGPKLLPYQVPSDVKLVQDASSSSSSSSSNTILLQLLYMEEGLEITTVSLERGEPVADMAAKVRYPQDASSLGQAELAIAVCTPRRDKGMGCRVLLATDDHAIAMLHHPGKLVWVREEALASIAAVEMLDLPVSDTDAAIEKEFDHKETGFVGMFGHRLVSQILQLKSLLLTVMGLGDPPSAGQRAGLVRDEFGLHKMIVAATSVGKVFGIDNLSGEVLWRQRLQDVAAYPGHGTNRNQLVLYVQRTTRHFPHPAQCALLARHKVTGEGVLYTFNPFNGLPIGGMKGPVHLGYRVKQTTLLQQPNELFLRGILLLDDKDGLHVYPENMRAVAAQLAGSTFIFTAEATSGILVGYSLAFSTEEKLVASRAWEARLGHQITAVVGKSPVERVHSQGRVLGDRSVLYKYMNPNLVAFLTQGFDPVHKHFLNIFLIDVVSGSVVFSVSHKRVRDPVHLVHSENWLLYSYFSDKTRRTEVVTLELYEGKVQSNTTAFSSVASPIQPIVDQQAYILPGNIEAMRETITEKGITSKHILVALATGGVLELPWMFVDPRRPITVTAEMREEGVIPYMPELPIPSDSIINYNLTVQRVKGIHTSPSGLESTCLVLVHGLDLFYTRVAPSKTFDVLKEDFDHFLITAVLLGLTLASYITRRLASRKALKQAWK